jgi:hypothetical protein
MMFSLLKAEEGRRKRRSREQKVKMPPNQMYVAISKTMHVVESGFAWSIIVVDKLQACYGKTTTVSAVK